MATFLIKTCQDIISYSGPRLFLISRDRSNEMIPKTPNLEAASGQLLGEGPLFAHFPRWNLFLQP